MVVILIDYLFMLFIIALGTFGVFVVCNIACEYRNYSGGHKFVKAFKAESFFQRKLAVLQQSKDIKKGDVGKITYIGYIFSILCGVTAIFVIPFSTIMIFFNHKIGFGMYIYWCRGALVLGVLVFLIQLIDSLLNFLLRHSKH